MPLWIMDIVIRSNPRKRGNEDLLIFLFLQIKPLIGIGKIEQDSYSKNIFHLVNVNEKHFELLINRQRWLRTNSSLSNGSFFGITGDSSPYPLTKFTDAFIRFQSNLQFSHDCTACKSHVFLLSSSILSLFYSATRIQ